MKKETSEDKLREYLSKKYNSLVLNKEQMREELGIAKSTLDLYISKNEGIPPYRKLGSSKNARLVFNIADVAKFLDNTVSTVY
jgi:predicted DNA-binding transcriptional regulator AlpA